MNPGSDNHSSEAQRLMAAAEWADCLRAEDASEEQIARWLQWCEQDPRNRQAFERVQTFWQISGALAGEVVNGELIDAQPSVPRESSSYSSPGPGPRAPGPSHSDRSGGISTQISLFASLTRYDKPMEQAVPQRRRANRRPVFRALAASIAAVAVIAAAWTAREILLWPTLADNAVLAAAPAETLRQAKLSDGSKLQLGAKSTVAVRYSQNRRVLELQGGEAYFSVESDKRRPFVVIAGDVRVRAVGTAFNIRRAGDRTVVTVTEGRVKVYRGGDIETVAAPVEGAAEPEAEPEDLVLAAAGEQITWDPDLIATGPRVETVNPAEVLAWRQGRLEYNDEPLDAVIADFNRYSDRPAVIRDDAIKGLRFSGTLLTEVTNDWLQALPAIFPVQVRLQNGQYIIEHKT